jgi:TatD DNase family protein
LWLGFISLYVDTHCHLNFESFDTDRAGVLARARESGVIRILNPGIDLPTSQAAVALAQANPEVYSAIGVHPNSALSWTTGTLDELRQLARHAKVVAIGEIGLDYYRTWAPQDLQRNIFQQQLQLAAEVHLPVVIHSRNKSAEDRRAVVDVISMLAEWAAELRSQGLEVSQHPGVLHSYSDNADTAVRVFGLGFFIGVTGPVTFRSAVELQDVVAASSLDHLLIETDAPFLTPHPYRGKRNEPAYVRFVAERIAQIHNLPVEEVAEITTMNAVKLFHW